VAGLDIGLLPLVDEDHARGKSPIKSIQYCACAVPVVGNVVGATAEILSDTNSIAVTSDAEWVEALVALCADPQRRETMGNAGRSVAETQHDLKTNAERLLTVLRGHDRSTDGQG